MPLRLFLTLIVFNAFISLKTSAAKNPFYDFAGNYDIRSSTCSTPFSKVTLSCAADQEYCSLRYYIPTSSGEKQVDQFLKSNYYSSNYFEGAAGMSETFEGPVYSSWERNKAHPWYYSLKIQLLVVNGTAIGFTRLKQGSSQYTAPYSDYCRYDF